MVTLGQGVDKSVALKLRLSVKRGADIALSVILISTALLPMLLIALAIRVTMGSPVLFRQVRPGRRQRPFTLLKFRTMTLEGAPEGEGAVSHRLTPLGAYLRAFSLDELPQLFNVLVGEMSLVGPRPLLVRYLPYFSAVERVRFAMRPGITGLAQTEGRNTLSWDERLALDVEYVQAWTLRRDVRILAKTIGKVLRRSGAIVDPAAVMEDLDEERRTLHTNNITHQETLR